MRQLSIFTCTPASPPEDDPAPGRNRACLPTVQKEGVSGGGAPAVPARSLEPEVKYYPVDSRQTTSFSWICGIRPPHHLALLHYIQPVNLLSASGDAD
jgi:hypothetical protein